MAIFEFNDILETVEMIRDENLDIRTITMGISLFDCVSDDEKILCCRIYDKICKKAENLVSCGDSIEKRYGIPIINKRVSVTPISLVAGAIPATGYVNIAKALDKAASTLGIDFIGGFGALVQKGMSDSAANRSSVIPGAFVESKLDCSCVKVA